MEWMTQITTLIGTVGVPAAILIILLWQLLPPTIRMIEAFTNATEPIVQALASIAASLRHLRRPPTTDPTPATRNKPPK